MAADVEVVLDPIVVSWSEISDFRQCPFKHHQAYRLRWQTDQVSLPLQRGTDWHLIMEQHALWVQAGGPKARHADRVKAAALHATAIQGLLGLRKDDEQTEEQELLAWMYEGYLEQYGYDPDWKILAVEVKLATPLPNPHGGLSRFVLKGKIDLVVEINRRVVVVDRKTGKRLPSDKELDLDDQFGLYTWLARQLGYQPFYAIHDFARTQRNQSEMTLDQRFQRTPLVFTDRQLDTIAAEAYATCERMWPVEPITKAPERNTDTEMCRWKCGFLEPCLAARKGINPDPLYASHGFVQSQFRPVELAYEGIDVKPVGSRRRRVAPPSAGRSLKPAT